MDFAYLSKIFCLKGFHAVAEVTDDVLEDVVVGNLLEFEVSHQLEVDLCSFNPGVDILSVDKVLLGFDKVIVVHLL
jgi:hypothetical protein